MDVTIIFLISAILISQADGLNNGLLQTPPMGWLSWEKFRCTTKCNVDYDEKLFIQIADALVHNGFKDVGYNRVNIDDCWMSKARDLITGQLLPDPIRFPKGIKYLSKYMHKNGLKLGIYQNFGLKTCMGFPGMMFYSEKDAQTFAEWEVDMIKLDACFTSTKKLDNGYIEFGKFLQKANSSIAYSCSWPYYQVHVSKTHIIPKWDLISLNCNLFRVYHDIYSKWSSILSTIDFMADNQNIFRRITGPGSWPDPDMLLIGNKGLNLAQSEAQMAVWCMLPAPLFMSNDPRTLNSKYGKILKNRKAISINQDSLAFPGERIFHNSTLDLFRRKLSNKKMALVVLNRTPSKINVSVLFDEILFEEMENIDLFNVTNIFDDKYFVLNRKTGDKNPIDVTVKATGVIFLHFDPFV